MVQRSDRDTANASATELAGVASRFLLGLYHRLKLFF